MSGTAYSSIYDWMVNYKRCSVKPATYDRLLTSLNAFGKYDISRIPVKKMTSADVQRYINELASDGYKMTTIKKQLALLTGYFRYAMAEGIVSKPICNNVRLPSYTSSNKKSDVEAYSDDEQEALHDILVTLDKDEYAAIMLMLTSGLRAGEVIALEWSDILWAKRAVSVNKTAVRLCNSGEKFIQDSAKTFTSNRTVPMSREMTEMLRALWERSSDESPYIFHFEDGEAITYDSLRWAVQRVCRLADVEYKGLHIFRHTFATNCYYKGCDVKVLSRLLGHASVNITYNTYIHLYGDALEDMRNIVDG